MAISSSASLAFLLSTVWPGRKRISVWFEALYWSMLPTTCSTVVQAGGRLLSRSAAPQWPCCRRRWRAGRLRWPCRGQLDAVLGARVGVFDHLAVRGGQLIELVDAVADRLGLALHILLAGKGIDACPRSLHATAAARGALPVALSESRSTGAAGWFGRTRWSARGPEVRELRPAAGR